MQRREFLIKTGLATGSIITGAATAARSQTFSTPAAGPDIHWQRSTASRLFTSAIWNGQPMPADPASGPGLLDAHCRLLDDSSTAPARLTATQSSARCGPVQLSLTHHLHDTGAQLGEDLLEASLVVRNDTDRDHRVELGFVSGVSPHPTESRQNLYLPLSAASLNVDRRFNALGVEQFLKDCNQVIDGDPFQCHYLEPGASYPEETTTTALLLASVIDLCVAGRPHRVALFTASDQPMRFRTSSSTDGKRIWQAGRTLSVPARSTFTLRCWLLLHTGDASVAWKCFHRFAHHEEYPALGWIQDFRVHYYDFLASANGREGHRGDGYEAAIPWFRRFRVGLATQHGYYPTLGDYIHPDRKSWIAMQGDQQGSVDMSFDKMRDRIRATRAAGAKAAIYLHPVLFDDATPFFNEKRDSVLVGADGNLVPFPWQGPDTKGKNWRASLACPEWRAHLLQQADWIMDILQPDALCIDETFAGIGYDHHPDHAGPTSSAAIDWHRKLRSLVRSYGADKAVFTSDCSMSPFVLWADGEVGDHAYSGLLGSPRYRQEPVRYLAALGDKPWRPCAWHFTRMWDLQMQLARQVGSGVGVANGWLEYTGLHRLSESLRNRLIADIESLH